MRIGIYGGSFNPVHAGHVGVARRALADLALDRLLVVPANVSPFKTEHPMPWNRLALVEAAFRPLAGARVDARELRRGGISYTIDTVREIAAENPGAALFLIVGEDSLAGFPKWRAADEIRSLCTVRAYPRTVESSTEIRRLFETNGVVRNPDGGTAAAAQEALRRDGGVCPCGEFLSQLAEPAFCGACRCGLYVKP